jgi:hypothetical protein
MHCVICGCSPHLLLSALIYLHKCGHLSRSFEINDARYFWQSSSTYLEQGDITFCETVYFCQTVQHHIPEDCDLHTHCCEHLKCHFTQFIFLTTSCRHFSALLDNWQVTIKVSVLHADPKIAGCVLYMWIVFIKFECWLGHLLNFCVVLWFLSVCGEYWISTMLCWAHLPWCTLQIVHTYPGIHYR